MLRCKQLFDFEIVDFACVELIKIQFSITINACVYFNLSSFSLVHSIPS